jgi:hypothetical protein
MTMSPVHDELPIQSASDMYCKLQLVPSAHELPLGPFRAAAKYASPGILRTIF